jgi:hypothetical protein
MSESKTRLEIENRKLKNDKQDLTFKLVRLLAYVINLQDDYPDMAWPDFPDSYSDMVWKYAA